MGILDKESIAGEVRRYGAAGGRPQVVWPNGVLASIAVGLFVQLVTPWHDHPISTAYLEYDGNSHTVKVSNRLAAGVEDRKVELGVLRRFQRLVDARGFGGDGVAEFAEPHRRERVVRHLEEISDEASARVAARAFCAWAIAEGLLAEEG